MVFLDLFGSIGLPAGGVRDMAEVYDYVYEYVFESGERWPGGDSRSWLRATGGGQVEVAALNWAFEPNAGSNRDSSVHMCMFSLSVSYECSTGWYTLAYPFSI